MRRRTVVTWGAGLVLALAMSACEPPDPRVASADGDNLRLTPRLVFSTVGREERPARIARVVNRGGSPIVVTGLEVSGTRRGSFLFVDGQSRSFTVPAGGAREIAMVFRPRGGSGLVHVALLTVSFADRSDPTATVALKGFNARDDQEPPLADIVATLGYTTDVGPATVPLSTSPEPIGEEVTSAYWRAGIPSRPVRLIPIARYAQRFPESTRKAGWFPAGGERQPLYRFPFRTNLAGGENQRLLPLGSAPGRFRPNGPFGVYLADSFSDPQRNGPNRTHDLRFYPARDTRGRIARAWIVAVDERLDGSKDHDYQDVVFLLVNAVPSQVEASTVGMMFVGTP